MTGMNVSGDISRNTEGYFSKQFLKRAQVNMLLERFGQIDAQGMNNTRTRNWRRYESLAHADSPLAEGITPSAKQILFTDYQAILEQYGDVVQISDVVMDTHIDPVMNQMTPVMAEQAAETIEKSRYYVLRGGTNVFYANNAAGRDSVNATVSRGDLRKIYRTLRRNRAQEISEIQKSSPDYGTESIGRSFVGICHTDLESDLRNVSGFVPVEKYANISDSMPGEIGKIENIRFMTSPLYEPFFAAGASGTTYLSNGAVPVSSANADVYPILIFGRDSYGIVPLKGKKGVELFVVNPKPVQGDPLAQRGFIGWKAWQGSAVLNQMWLVRYEVAVTGNPT